MPMKIEQITMNSFRVANELFTPLNQLARVCNACLLPDFNHSPAPSILQKHLIPRGAD